MLKPVIKTAARATKFDATDWIVLAVGVALVAYIIGIASASDALRFYCGIAAGG